MTASEISAKLADRIEDLAEMLVGEAPTFRSRNTIRFYAKGGLAVTTAGRERGLWCSHGDGGIGGDALDLVKHLRACSMKEAIAWARDWLGTAPAPAPRIAPARRSAPAPDNMAIARQIWREAMR